MSISLSSIQTDTTDTDLIITPVFVSYTLTPIVGSHIECQCLISRPRAVLTACQRRQQIVEYNIYCLSRNSLRFEVFNQFFFFFFFCLSRWSSVGVSLYSRKYFYFSLINTNIQESFFFSPVEFLGFKRGGLMMTSC